jgi:GlpG protein
VLRQIGVLPSELDPAVLSDHLLALGMTSRIVQGPGGWAVWVHDENQLARAKAELDAFLAQPDDPRFRQSARVAEDVRREEARKDREFRRNFREVSDQWTGLRLRRRPLTMALVLGSIAVFVLQNSTWGFRVENALLISSLHPGLEGGWTDNGLRDILSGQLWRLVTPILLHSGIFHILFNSWAILVEGTMIETHRGTLRLGVLVLVSALLSNLGQYFYMDRMDPHGLHAFGGLSGVGFALFGYLWMKGQYEPEQGMILHPSTTVLMLTWLVLCMTGLMGPIANAAHLVGLFVGVVFGVLRF